MLFVGIVPFLTLLYQRSIDNPIERDDDHPRKHPCIRLPILTLIPLPPLREEAYCPMSVSPKDYSNENVSTFIEIASDMFIDLDETISSFLRLV